MVVLSARTVERIDTSARAMHPGRMVLTMLASVLYALAWLVAKVFAVIWLIITWCVAALKVGFTDGLKRKRIEDDR
jgi:uncharacterized membrane protein